MVARSTLPGGPLGAGGGGGGSAGSIGPLKRAGAGKGLILESPASNRVT